jgi:hypothetical protein
MFAREHIGGTGQETRASRGSIAGGANNEAFMDDSRKRRPAKPSVRMDVLRTA